MSRHKPRHFHECPAQSRRCASPHSSRLERGFPPAALGSSAATGPRSPLAAGLPQGPRQEFWCQQWMHCRRRRPGSFRFQEIPGPFLAPASSIVQLSRAGSAWAAGSFLLLQARSHVKDSRTSGICEPLFSMSESHDQLSLVSAGGQAQKLRSVPSARCLRRTTSVSRRTASSVFICPL